MVFKFIYFTEYYFGARDLSMDTCLPAVNFLVGFQFISTFHLPVFL